MSTIRFMSVATPLTTNFIGTKVQHNRKMKKKIFIFNSMKIGICACKTEQENELTIYQIYIFITVNGKNFPEKWLKISW